MTYTITLHGRTVSEPARAHVADATSGRLLGFASSTVSSEIALLRAFRNARGSSDTRLMLAVEEIERGPAHGPTAEEDAASDVALRALMSPDTDETARTIFRLDRKEGPNLQNIPIRTEEGSRILAAYYGREARYSPPPAPPTETPTRGNPASPEPHAALLKQVQDAWDDPDMEVAYHTPDEVRTLMMFCQRSFSGGRRWAAHRKDHVWLGYSAEDALQQALAAAPKTP